MTHNIQETQDEILRLGALSYNNTFLIMQSIEMQENITHKLQTEIDQLDTRLHIYYNKTESCLAQA